MKIIAVAGLKGGVGKTSTAVNLAALAASRGWRTVLWDIDAQGAVEQCVTIADPTDTGPNADVVSDLAKSGSALLDRARPTTIGGLSVVTGDSSLRGLDRTASKRRTRKRLRSNLEAMRNRVDVLVVDSPPGIGDAFELLANLADIVILPTEPAPLAINALRGIEPLVRERTPAHPMAVLSMVDERKPMHRRMLGELAGDPSFATAAIPYSSAVERMGETRIPTVVHSPNSLAAQRYGALWAELAALLGLPR